MPPAWAAVQNGWRDRAGNCVKTSHRAQQRAREAGDRVRETGREDRLLELELPMKSERTSSFRATAAPRSATTCEEARLDVWVTDRRGVLRALRETEDAKAQKREGNFASFARWRTGSRSGNRAMGRAHDKLVIWATRRRGTWTRQTRRSSQAAGESAERQTQPAGNCGRRAWTRRIEPAGHCRGDHRRENKLIAWATRR